MQLCLHWAQCSGELPQKTQCKNRRACCQWASPTGGQPPLEGLCATWDPEGLLPASWLPTGEETLTDVHTFLDPDWLSCLLLSQLPVTHPAWSSGERPGLTELWVLTVEVESLMNRAAEIVFINYLTVVGEEGPGIGSPKTPAHRTFFFFLNFMSE